MRGDPGAGRAASDEGATRAATLFGSLPPRATRAIVGTLAFALVVIAFLIRVVPVAPTVFSGPAGARLFDTDSYYHLRHARFAAAHFPSLQRWDPGLYPAGQPKRYAGLFDVALGGAALLAGGTHPSDAQLARAAAVVPPLLGALVVAALFWLAARARNGVTGLVALAFVTLYPGNFVHRSLLGAVDHHVAEILLSVLTALGIWRAVARATNDDPVAARTGSWRLRARAWGPDALSPLPLAIFLFTWFGAPIYLVITALTFFVLGSVLLARDGTARGTARAAFRYGIGLLLLLGAARLLAPGLIMEASYFRKALGAAALFALGVPGYLLAGTALVARLSADERASRGRIATLVAMGGGLLVVLVLGAGLSFSKEASGLIGSLLEVKTDLVKEQAPVTLARYAMLGGAPAFLALASLPLALFAAWRAREGAGATDARTRAPEAKREAARLAVALFAMLVVGLWLRTRDYGYVAPPFLACLGADALARLLARVRAPRTRVAVAGVVALATLLPVWPLAAAAPVVPDRAAMRDMMILRPGWEQALAWMRDATPSLERPLDAPIARGEKFRHPAGNYGVLAFWDFGHYVAELGRRPPVASGGISTSTAKWFLMPDEDRAIAALGEGLLPGERVRYCIADAQTAGDFVISSIQMVGENLNDFIQIFIPGAMPDRRLMRFGPRYRQSMIARLYEDDGADLGHFRMVYASPEKNLLAYHAPLAGGAIVRKATAFAGAEDEAQWRASVVAGRPLVTRDEIVYDGRYGPAVKIFEQVAGARLQGQALPGANLEARLDLTARAGAHGFHYRRVGHAGADGRFEIVVPYPTESSPVATDVVAQAPYELRLLDETSTIIGRATASTEDIEAGRAVAVTPVQGAPATPDEAVPAKTPASRQQ